MFTLHFVVAILTCTLMVAHLTLVHRSRPGSSHTIADGSRSILDVLLKDSLLLTPLLMTLFLPEARLLIHPDNWMPFNTVVTPPHIEPEVYFL